MMVGLVGKVLLRLEGDRSCCRTSYLRDLCDHIADTPVLVGVTGRNLRKTELRQDFRSGNLGTSCGISLPQDSCPQSMAITNGCQVVVGKVGQKRSAKSHA